MVAHRTKPDILLVRSRIAGDIQKALPHASVWEDETADYRYRAEVDRKTVALAIARSIEEIDYTNFKNSVRDPVRHRAYMDVWQVMEHEYADHAPPEQSREGSADLDAYRGD